MVNKPSGTGTLASRWIRMLLEKEQIIFEIIIHRSRNILNWNERQKMVKELLFNKYFVVLEKSRKGWKYSGKPKNS